MFATHASIIEKIGIPALAEALGLEQSHIRTMKARNSIPVRYWLKVVEAAALKEIGGVTHETLANIAAAPISAERAEELRRASA